MKRPAPAFSQSSQPYNAIVSLIPRAKFSVVYVCMCETMVKRHMDGFIIIIIILILTITITITTPRVLSFASQHFILACVNTSIFISFAQFKVQHTHTP